MLVKSAKEIISFSLNSLATKTLKPVQGDMFCHPEFISGSYYSQGFVKYCQNRFFGRCPQNDDINIENFDIINL